MHFGQEVLGWKAAERSVPEPLVPHGTDAPLHFLCLGDAAKGCGDHVAVLEGGHEFRSLGGIMPEPVQEFGEAPLRRINTAAPIDGRKLFAMRSLCDFRSLGLGAMIAPQVIVIERLEIFSDGNNGRTGRVQSDGQDLIGGSSGFPDGLACSCRQCAHVIFVRLRGAFGIFAFAMERIFSGGRSQQSPFAVNDGNTNAQMEIPPACISAPSFPYKKRMFAATNKTATTVAQKAGR